MKHHDHFFFIYALCKWQEEIRQIVIEYCGQRR